MLKELDAILRRICKNSWVYRTAVEGGDDYIECSSCAAYYYTGQMQPNSHFVHLPHCDILKLERMLNDRPKQIS